MFCTSGLHDLDGHVTVQIQLPLHTATHVLQHKPGIVVVVGAKIVIAVDPIIEHANILNELMVLEILEKFPVIGFTLSQTAIVSSTRSEKNHHHTTSRRKLVEPHDLHNRGIDDLRTNGMRGISVVS